MKKQYIPNMLTSKDKKKQLAALLKSQREYKKNIYIIRPKLKSFPIKESKHVTKAKKIYNVKSIKPSAILAKRTKCSLETLKAIEKKGQGAYYSSGSRPSQTPHSWGRARLASTLTGGKSSIIDYKLLMKGCQSTSRAKQIAQIEFNKKHLMKKKKKTKKINGKQN